MTDARHIAGMVASGEPFEFGNSRFSGKASEFIDGTPLPDLEESGVLCMTSVRRFLTLANLLACGASASRSDDGVPTMYLVTNDFRRQFGVYDVGGIGAALRFREENGDEAEIPVILFAESNQQVLKASEIDEGVRKKLDRGIYTRLWDGDPQHFVDGRSFDGWHEIGTGPQADVKPSAPRY